MMKITGGVGRGYIVSSHEVACATVMFHEDMVRYCGNFGFAGRQMTTVLNVLFRDFSGWTYV